MPESLIVYFQISEAAVSVIGDRPISENICPGIDAVLIPGVTDMINVGATSH